MVTAERLDGVRFGRTVIGCAVGDAFGQDTEAVVLAATRRGLLGTAVSAGLRSRGAGEIERLAMAAAPLALGTALVTGAPGLDSLGVRAIVHASVHSDLGEAARIEDIRRAVAAVFAAAESAHWRSVALPLLGLDGAVVVPSPAERLVDAIVDELVGCLRRGSSRPDRVVLVARSPEHATIADRVLARARRRLWTLDR